MVMEVGLWCGVFWHGFGDVSFWLLVAGLWVIGALVSGVVLVGGLAASRRHA